MIRIDHHSALLVIDVQRGFDDPAWGLRNNPRAEANIARLIAVWRELGAPIVHVHHDSPHPSGRLRKDAIGHAPKPEAQPIPGEPVYCKQVNSAFIGTTLETDLRAQGVCVLVIVGFTTNHCISTTARMAGNLGFETFVIADATATFDRAHIDGSLRLAEEVHRSALSDLQGEFAEVLNADAILLQARGGQAPS